MRSYKKGLLRYTRNDRKRGVIAMPMFRQKQPHGFGAMMQSVIPSVSEESRFEIATLPLVARNDGQVSFLHS